MPQLKAARLLLDARGVATACAAALVLLAVPTPSPAASQQELARARAERQAVQQKLDRTVAAYDAAQAKLAKTQASIKANQAALAEAEKTAQIVEQRMSRRADSLYRMGPAAIFQYLLDAASFGDFGRRLTLIEAASNEDAIVLAHANKSRADIARLTSELEAQEAQERKLLDEMSAQTRTLSDSFAQAQTLETRLAADREAARRREAERAARAAAEAAQRARAQEEARKQEEARRKAEAAAKASPSPSSSPSSSPRSSPSPSPSAGPSAQILGTRTMRCPVDGPTSFTDTFGAPRSGGRTHQGVDMFAASGTPVAAMVEGSVLRKSSSAAGGISLYFTGNDGNEYFYAHLSGYAEISPGQKMQAGGHLGYVGNTGNAEGGPPHLHFEARPKGGAPVNPTSLVRRACG